MSRIFVIHTERFHRQVLPALAARGIETVLLCASDRKGYEDLRHLVPGAVHISTHEAMSGLVPPPLASRVRPASAADLRALAPHEGLALLMIERLNFFDRSTLEMRRLYVRYASVWQALLDELRPDAVLFQSPPHMGYDYVLWAVARRRGVRTLIVDRTSLNDRLLLYEDLEQIPGPDPAQVAGPAPEPPAAASAPAIEAEAEEPEAALADAPADGGAGTYLEGLNREANDLEQIRRGLTALSLARIVVGRDFLRSLSERHLAPLSARPPSMLRARLLDAVRSVQVRRALALYDAAARPVDLGADFVYVPLHFQPERTTVPGGGFLADQLHSLEILLAALPAGWRAYVKEHPRQFSRTRGLLNWHKVRSPEFYRKLAGDPRIALVPLATPSDALIDRCRAVATTTGTAGWEAVGRGKPALVFGFPWYLRCPGVVQVPGVEECAAALRSIADGTMRADPGAVRRWTDRLIREHTFKGAFSDRLLALSQVTPEENAGSYAEAVARAMDGTARARA